MKFALFLGVIAIIGVSGNELKCYKCDDCPDPFTKNDTLLTKCGTTDTHCAKGVLTLHNDSLLFRRDCVGIDSIQGPIKPVSLNLSLYHSASIYFCNTEGCNGTGSISAVISIIFTTLVASIFASF